MMEEDVSSPFSRNEAESSVRDDLLDNTLRHRGHPHTLQTGTNKSPNRIARPRADGAGPNVRKAANATRTARAT
jgi:hypothetical protein